MPTSRTAAVFTKKPVDIEAIVFTGDWSSGLDVMRWAQTIYFVPRGYEHQMRKDNESDRGNGHILEDAPAFLVVRTLEGEMRADAGDWIIKGVQGEFYPCKPDIFEQTYNKKA